MEQCSNSRTTATGSINRPSERCTPIKTQASMHWRALIEKIRVKCVSVSVQLGCRDAGGGARLLAIYGGGDYTGERASRRRLGCSRELAKKGSKQTRTTRLGGHAPPRPLLLPAHARTHTHALSQRANGRQRVARRARGC
jgi:hypothetical protein